ncbi:MAG: ester cyclase [Acidobacteria bacterium]|nr:ester cyclase [Acidobacteriota bacterium]
MATSEENKAIIRRYCNELWNEWNLDLVDEFISEKISFRGSLGLTVLGRDGFKAYVELVRSAFPDFHKTVEELIAEGDRVVARLTFHGTHKGRLFGYEPTGRQVSYAGAGIFRLRDGKIVDGWVLGDTLNLTRQIETPNVSGPGIH